MKKLVLLGLVLVALPLAQSLTFDVRVDQLTSMETTFMDYRQEAEPLQKVNLSVLNTGSIGCAYRLKGEFTYRNTTRERFSEPYLLWPSERTEAELYFIAENYTGKVEASIYSTYCDQRERVANFTFQSEAGVANRTLESRTVRVEEDRVKISTKLEDGLLVPKNTPPYWKASSARIRNGTAEIHYDPPIFNPEEQLTYTVLRNGSIAAETSIELEEPEPGYWDRLRHRAPRILAILLGLSVVLNLKYFVARREPN